jgi:hypothetical protein
VLVLDQREADEALRHPARSPSRGETATRSRRGTLGEHELGMRSASAVVAQRTDAPL